MFRAHHNPALYESMKSYVEAAIELVLLEVTSKANSSVDDEAFFFARLAATDELTKLQEYQRCLDALKADSTICSQTETLAGTNSGRRSRTQSPEGLMRTVLDLGLNKQQSAYDPERFEREYSRFEEAYYCSEIVYEVIAPLPGITVSQPLRLADDLELASLPLEELNSRLGSKGQSSEYSFGDEVCVVRSEYRLPKVVGEDKQHSLQDREQDQARQRAVNDRIEQVINALRLSGIENAYQSVIIHRPSQWAFDQERFFPSRFQPDIFFVSNLEDQWLQGFAVFWGQLQSEGIQKRRFLEVSIRRLGYAHERPRLEDKIIDLMIAAEALFLSDYKKDSYFGEIRYRLSLRAALFLANEPEAEKLIFRWMRAAYDLRSTLAHGGEVSRAKLPKHPDGSDVSVADFVATIQTYIRIALVKAVNIAQVPTAPFHLVDWDELVFSGKSNDVASRPHSN
jgi:hypothetical protein